MKKLDFDFSSSFESWGNDKLLSILGNPQSLNCENQYILVWIRHKRQIRHHQYSENLHLRVNLFIIIVGSSTHINFKFIQSRGEGGGNWLIYLNQGL